MSIYFNIRVILISFAAFLLQQGAAAQDLHFSQFFNNPLVTNPANTGFIPDADYRLGASYRNQYSNIMAQPYKTISVFGDAQVLRNKIETGWMGLGGAVLSDVAGTGSLTSTKVYASIAYHQELGYSSLLTAGFNLGWVNKRIDPSKLTFPDQFDGRFFDASLPTSVVLANNNVSYFDMQVGMNYAYFPTQDIYINAGYSIQHVNQAKETFFEDPSSDQISMRHIAFLNGLFRVADKVIINPNIYFTTQAGASEFELGMNAAYNLTEHGEKQIIAGLYYRYTDAVIPMVGLEVNNIRFTFSYDVTVSSLKNYNYSMGANEFNLLKKGFYNEYQGDRRQSLCPVF
ncbi:MAG TPA: PorP/SprF family type IX secretion system membrane protein [Chitinophagaceae bacterium]|nr:PorP/SprF family type IX secretion system membrane protein [Chitinophagaceae bacterium]